MWLDKTNSLISRLIKPGTNSLKVKKSSFKSNVVCFWVFCKMLYKRMKINKLHNSVFSLLWSWNKMTVNDMHSRKKAVGTTVPTKMDVYLELSKPIKLWNTVMGQPLHTNLNGQRIRVLKVEYKKLIKMNVVARAPFMLHYRFQLFKDFKLPLQNKPNVNLYLLSFIINRSILL